MHYAYIHYISLYSLARHLGFATLDTSEGGGETVGNPHQARISQCELFELVLFLKLDKQLPVGQFEAAVSSQQYSPPLLGTRS